MDADRIKKIKESIPKKCFFEKCFELNGFPTKILMDLKLSTQGLEHNNILNCSVVLNKEQEYHLFRKYNYLKYRLLKLTVGFEKTKEKPAPKPSPAVKLERLQENSLVKIEKTIEKINEVRNILIKSNMRLVVKQIGRYAPTDSFRRDEFFSNAYMHIIKAIDCFDHRLGYKFSTYCINVLKTNLNRDNSYEYKKLSVVENSDQLKFALSDKEDLSHLNQEYNKIIVEKIFEEIRRKSKRSADEIEILKGYYGFGTDKMILKDLAEKLGISRERVRQLKLKIIDLIKKSNIVYDPLV